MPEKASLRIGDSELRARAGKIRFLLMDADGILTDGRISMAPDGSEWKNFDARDGLGIKIGQGAGIGMGVVSGRRSAAIERRAVELKFEEIHQGVKDKLRLFEALCERRGLEPAEVAYVGDDLVDIGVMQRAGLAFAVPDAPDEVQHVAHVVTARTGGRGAVREVIECVIRARGDWEEVLRGFGASP